MPSPQPPLAPLPFGQASARAFDDVASCGDFLARQPEAPSRFDAIGPDDRFRIRFLPVSFPGLTLFAGTSTPKATDHQSGRLALVIPFGSCASVIRSGGQEYRWASPHHAFVIPAGHHVEAESTAGSFLRLDIAESALIRAAKGMAGTTPSKQQPLDLHSPRIVPMAVHGMDWLPVIRSFCGSVDAFGCDAGGLTAAGVDDVILRTVVMMLNPETFLDPPSGTRPPRGFDLGPLLDRTLANLTGRVTLSDMEHWSGRTARCIQLAFQKRFGIGPMQWLRDQRLDLVRAELLAATTDATVKEIARTCGMPRMATLIPEYVRRFGELPSETLRRSRR